MSESVLEEVDVEQQLQDQDDSDSPVIKINTEVSEEKKEPKFEVGELVLDAKNFKVVDAANKEVQPIYVVKAITTDEFIVCKNNKFEYGRYNTTATNLKLYRPLLLNKPGGQKDKYGRTSAGGTCLGNIFNGSTRISSTQNIYANTSNQLTKKETYVLLSKQQFRPFR